MPNPLPLKTFIIALFFLAAIPGSPLTGHAEKKADAEIINLQNSKFLVLEQAKRDSNPDSRIKEHKIMIRRLQEGLVEQKIKVLGSKTQERNLLGDLEEIDLRLLDQRQELTRTNELHQQQNLLLEDKQQAIKQLLAAKEKSKLHIQARLSAYYQMGEVGLMNVIFSTVTLPELLSFQDHFQYLLQHDQQALNTYLGDIDQLVAARDELVLEGKQLADIKEKLQEEEVRLAATQQEKLHLLDRVNTEKTLYQQAAVELEKAAGQLSRTLESLSNAAAPNSERRDSSNKASPSSDQGFSGQQGNLPPPVAGTVIKLFGESSLTAATGINSFADGIAITAEEGSPIKAVYDGKVIHSGYLRGYGNMLIIDHGQQYYTLVARASEFFKKEGIRVAGGEVIGVMGKNAALLGEGLYFEIRQGSKTLDPMQWLDNALLTVKAADR